MAHRPPRAGPASRLCDRANVCFSTKLSDTLFGTQSSYLICPDLGDTTEQTNRKSFELIIRTVFVQSNDAVIIKFQKYSY
jgi:hypothetical protein